MFAKSALLLVTLLAAVCNAAQVDVYTANVHTQAGCKGDKFSVPLYLANECNTVVGISQKITCDGNTPTYFLYQSSDCSGNTPAGTPMGTCATPDTGYSEDVGSLSYTCEKRNAENLVSWKLILGDCAAPDASSILINILLVVNECVRTYDDADSTSYKILLKGGNKLQFQEFEGATCSGTKLYDEEITLDECISFGDFNQGARRRRLFGVDLDKVANGRDLQAGFHAIFTPAVEGTTLKGASGSGSDANTATINAVVAATGLLTTAIVAMQ